MFSTPFPAAPCFDFPAKCFLCLFLSQLSHSLFWLYPAQRAGAWTPLSAICFAICLSFPPAAERRSLSGSNEPKKDCSDEHEKVELLSQQNLISPSFSAFFCFFLTFRQLSFIVFYYESPVRFTADIIYYYTTSLSDKPILF